MLQDGFLDRRKPVHIFWGDLPHWRQDGATYFVTFRLVDSIPQAKLAYWRTLRAEWQQANAAPRAEALDEFHREQRRRIEGWLDRGYGSCLLRTSHARKVIENEIGRLAGRRYELGEFAVAWNHVHVVVRTLPGHDLSKITGSWKRNSSAALRSARLASSPLLASALWQRESFDHIIRNAEQLDRIHSYIRRHRTGSIDEFAGVLAEDSSSVAAE